MLIYNKNINLPTTSTKANRSIKSYAWTQSIQFILISVNPAVFPNNSNTSNESTTTATLQANHN